MEITSDFGQLLGLDDVKARSFNGAVQPLDDAFEPVPQFRLLAFELGAFQFDVEPFEVAREFARLAAGEFCRFPQAGRGFVDTRRYLT